MSVSFPKGFVASGIATGIKSSGQPDLALVVNQGSKKDCAAVFTRNRVVAASVVYSRKICADNQLDAVILNSGCANACTGQQGYQDAENMAKAVAKELALSPDKIAVCSTGLIGEYLPMDKILKGIPAAVKALGEDGGTLAAKAIMTTDTVEKQARWESASGWRIGGMAKGAGMLAPGLATMLVVLTTDAQLTIAQLTKSLTYATKMTFDRTDADGCMSTNDSVILMSSGARRSVVNFEEFKHGLEQVCSSLAGQLIADAEGASHEISITVAKAFSEDDALEVARAIARSNLFKCAIFGNDPNWGRILSAVGTTKAIFEPDEIDVSFNGIKVCKCGQIGADRSKVDLTSRHVEVLVELNAGSVSATVLTSDLTFDYVKENAEYSS